MRKPKRVFVLIMLSVFLYGCGRSVKDTVVIGRSEDKAGSVPLSALNEVVPEGEASTSLSVEAQLCVYVCGAVNSPGVVTLKPGSRVEDALKAAGGFAEDADRNAVNLADWVSDGEQIFFLTVEQAAELEERKSSDGSGLVNINTADAAALCTLPGIGETRAQDIIEYREKNGGFETEEDVMKVSGIKTSVYEKIRDKITVK